MYRFRLVTYCCIDILLPFISFFVLLDIVWPAYNWLIAPVMVLFVVAIIFIYIIAQNFPAQPKEQWKLIRSSMLAIAFLLLSSGSYWIGGLFQYSLVSLIALSASFGWVLPKQHSVVGWIFGGIALLWTVFASWVSYRFYAATFVISWDGIIWIVWPLWLLVVIPQIKKRYRLVDSFFKKQKRE